MSSSDLTELRRRRATGCCQSSCVFCHDGRDIYYDDYSILK